MSCTLNLTIRCRSIAKSYVRVEKAFYLLVFMNTPFNHRCATARMVAGKCIYSILFYYILVTQKETKAHYFACQ
jgi:hypothetical protein